MATSTRISTAPDRPARPPRRAACNSTDGSAGGPPHNAANAAAIDRLADRLAERGANEHRVRAYRRAAETVRSHPKSLAALLSDGSPDSGPAIGENIAGASPASSRRAA